MICVTSRAVPGSAELAMKSGSAIGIGWTLPLLSSRRTAAPAGCGTKLVSAEAVAPAPNRSARRRSSQLLREVVLYCVIGSSLAGLGSKCAHETWIENDRHFLPVLIVLGPQHGVRLPAIDRADRALLRGEEQRAVALSAHLRRRRERAVGLELDLDLDGQFLRIPRAGGRIPELLQSRLQGAKLVLRSLRVRSVAPKRGLVARLGVRHHLPLQRALVEQRGDLTRIEGGLFRSRLLG